MPALTLSQRPVVVAAVVEANAACHTPMYNSVESESMPGTTDPTTDMPAITRASSPHTLTSPELVWASRKRYSLMAGAAGSARGALQAIECPRVLHTCPTARKPPTAAGTRAGPSDLLGSSLAQDNCRQLSMAAGCALYPLPLLPCNPAVTFPHLASHDLLAGANL